MKRILAVVIGSSLLLFAADACRAKTYKGIERPQIVQQYGTVPLAFEANQGQTNSQVKFLTRSAGYTLFLTSSEAVLSLNRISPHEPHSQIGKPLPDSEAKSAVLRMRLIGANSKAVVSGEAELPGSSNYFLGNDPQKWHANVSQFAKVLYRSVYPDVDLVYYGNQRQLEYDFLVHPGGNPGVIRLAIDGAKVRMDGDDLVVSSAAGDVCLRQPQVYQLAGGAKHMIRGHYIIGNNNEVGFRLADYDRSHPLVIDPILAYSTFLGGSSAEYGGRIVVDQAGNAYITGFTSSTNFPTANPIQPANDGYYDVFVTKLNRDGTAIVYSTYLGGRSSDYGYGIAVDSVGNAYVTGRTDSTDFPIVNGLQVTSRGGVEAFVTKINSSGSTLLYSTYLGGKSTDIATGIAADQGGNAYIVGETVSTDFPTVNPVQPSFHGYVDAFVAEINAKGSALLYSTFLGGSSDDEGQGIAVDLAGNAYVTGLTLSADFPVLNALQSTNHGGYDAFLTKIKAGGAAFAYSTYLGGSALEYGQSVAVDSAGNSYLTGVTQSTDFPTANALQPTNKGGDAFVTKIAADGNAFVYSTYLGGSSYENAYAIATDLAGNAYVTGSTGSSDFPIVNAIQPTNHGGSEAFVVKINSSGNMLVYGTYLGGSGSEDGPSWCQAYCRGIAVDLAGSAYVAGITYSRNFPKTTLALQQLSKGISDLFVTKIASQAFANVSPSNLHFPTQVIGAPSTSKRITLTNSGMNTLTINKIYIASINQSDFVQTNNCPATLTSGGACDIGVTFTPSAKNSRKGVLAISTSDPSSPAAVPLTGTGTTVSLSTTKLAFGKNSVGTSTSKYIALTNVGGTQLNFTGIAVMGTNAADFSQTNTCGTSIAAGANCVITVIFKPSIIGLRIGVLSISDDGGGSPQKVSLVGMGI